MTTYNGLGRISYVCIRKCVNLLGCSCVYLHAFEPVHPVGEATGISHFGSPKLQGQRESAFNKPIYPRNNKGCTTHGVEGEQLTRRTIVQSYCTRTENQQVACSRIQSTEVLEFCQPTDTITTTVLYFVRPRGPQSKQHSVFGRATRISPSVIPKLFWNKSC